MSRPRWVLVVIGAVAALTMMLAGCGGSGSSKKPTSPVSAAPTSATSSPAAPTTPSSNPAAVAEITKNWEAFFSKSTPISQRWKYLQDGATHKGTIQIFSSNPNTKMVTAKVKKVTLSGAQAAVIYDVLVGAHPALPDAAGVAVLQAGIWKVSLQTLCGLLGLLGTKNIPGCP